MILAMLLAATVTVHVESDRAPLPGVEVTVTCGVTGARSIMAGGQISVIGSVSSSSMFSVGDSSTSITFYNAGPLWMKW